MTHRLESCPDCHERLPSQKTQCRCGWKSQNTAVHDTRCEYTLQTRRCPLPGSLNAFPYAKHGWYCSGHYWHLNDSEKAEAILNEAEKIHQEKLSGLKTKRQESVNEKNLPRTDTTRQT